MKMILKQTPPGLAIRKRRRTPGGRMILLMSFNCYLTQQLLLQGIKSFFIKLLVKTQNVFPNLVIIKGVACPFSV